MATSTVNSWVVIYYDQCVLLTKLCSLCPTSFHTPRPNLEVSLDFILLYSNPLWLKDIFFLVLVLENLAGLHRIGQFQLLQHQWLVQRLGFCDVEWSPLERNWNHSVIFEIVPKYCILDSSVDYEGYSISSKKFLPTVVDIMVIWIKSAHSCAF